MFQSPDDLQAAGKGWELSPADVGLVPEVIQGTNSPMAYRKIEQPMDESVASEAEIEVASAKRARKAPIAPTTVSSRRRATSRK
ncbi:MAG: hypothetical protein ACYC2H_01320 [Thermoplasmatota archaeon]